MIDPRTLWQEQDVDHEPPSAREMRRMSLEGQQTFLRGVRWWIQFPQSPGYVVLVSLAIERFRGEIKRSLRRFGAP